MLISSYSPAPVHRASSSPQKEEIPSEERFTLGLDLARWAGEKVQDMHLLSQFVGMGQMYKLSEKRFAAWEATQPLKDSPQVTIDRPFVMVPGYTTRPDRFEALGHKLTEDGANGGKIVFVQDGKFFEERACQHQLSENPTSANKVFEIVLQDIREAPPVAADEIEKNFKAIQSATGYDKLDVDAYSMGGLGTRLYLDRGGDAVGKLLLLGTPNQGTRFAGLARDVIRRDIKFAMGMANLTGANLPALEWLAADDGQGHANPRLTELNKNFARQEARCESVLTLGGEEMMTPSSQTFWPVTGGDGLVEAKRLFPPGGQQKMLEGEKHHAYLNGDPDVYREMTGYFGWKEAT